MLTKEHLNYRVRAGRIRPVFLAADDAEALALARDMTALAGEAAGMRVGDLEEQLSALGDSDVGAAFQKLLLDGCEAEEDDGKVAEARWEALLRAQELRREQPGLTVQDFQRLVSGGAFETLRERLYADLPACRRIQDVRSTTAEALVARYNVAQVQGLLLRARSVTVSWPKDLPLPERRALFRQLKFHRLMGEVKEDAKTCSVILSGPLGIFDQAATYGSRLANFFPHVLHLSSWELRAEVSVKNKTLELRLDQDAGLASHYRRHHVFIPDELQIFVTAFNERGLGWQAEPGAEFVHVGRESYCFPDLTITGQDGRKVHVELFHRWHAVPLRSRLQALESNPVSNLLLGVSKNLAKSPEAEAWLAGSSWFGQNGFLFSEFPTPKTVAALLAKV